MKSFAAIAGLAAAVFGSASWAANTVDNGIASYFRDAVSTNTGSELILPYAQINSAQTNITLRFDVYPAGSGPKLFSTAGHLFSLQTAPSCAQAIDTWSDSGGHTDPVFIGNFEVQMYSLTRFCGNNGSGGNWQLVDTLVYGADVSKSGGATWYKKISNVYPGALSVIDANGDATMDVLIVTSPVNTHNTTVQAVNAATGATVVAPITRSQGNAPM